MASTIFRRGLDLQHEVADALAADYHSGLVDRIKEDDHQYRAGRLTVYLAREFGFCYGVDRAVDYAYQTRRRFPDRPVCLTGEIIHNPQVNAKLRATGIRFLSDPGESIELLDPETVVILPAFGLTITDLARLQQRGCTLVDTTCGSVLNVWKNVSRYARDGFTAVIHGKVHHEETQATASQALQYPEGRYLIILDCDEAAAVCDYIRHETNRDAFLNRFTHAVSLGFDPDQHLEHVGLANQTTMLMSESLAVGEMLRQALLDRYGENELASHYRAFDTICSATQDRQDAVQSLLHEHTTDAMIVVGGYNSSNTRNLAKLAAGRVPTYHVADATCLISPDQIRYRPVTAPPDASGEAEVVADNWIAPRGSVRIGLTAGASTPNNIVGEVVERLERFMAPA